MYEALSFVSSIPCRRPVACTANGARREMYIHLYRPQQLVIPPPQVPGNRRERRDSLYQVVCFITDELSWPDMYARPYEVLIARDFADAS